jgi:hypothetical protein
MITPWQIVKAMKKSRVIALLFLKPLRWMEVGGERLYQAVMFLGRRPGTHRTRGWVAPERAWMDADNLFPTGVELRTVEPVTSRYTDYAIVMNKT